MLASCLAVSGTLRWNCGTSCLLACFSVGDSSGLQAGYFSLLLQSPEKADSVHKCSKISLRVRVLDGVCTDGLCSQMILFGSVPEAMQRFPLPNQVHF